MFSQPLKLTWVPPSGGQWISFHSLRVSFRVGSLVSIPMVSHHFPQQKMAKNSEHTITNQFLAITMVHQCWIQNGSLTITNQCFLVSQRKSFFASFARYPAGATLARQTCRKNTRQVRGRGGSTGMDETNCVTIWFPLKNGNIMEYSSNVVIENLQWD